MTFHELRMTIVCPKTSRETIGLPVSAVHFAKEDGESERLSSKFPITGRPLGPGGLGKEFLLRRGRRTRRRITRRRASDTRMRGDMRT